MKYSLLNSDTLRLSTSSIMLQMLVMVNVGIEFSNKALRRLARPSSCGIQEHRAVTSMEIIPSHQGDGKGHVAYLLI